MPARKEGSVATDLHMFSIVLVYIYIYYIYILYIYYMCAYMCICRYNHVDFFKLILVIYSLIT